MKKNGTLIPSILIIVLCIAISFLLIFQQFESITKKSKIYPAKNTLTRSEPLLTKDYNEKITVGAIGDILIHDRVYHDAYHNGQYQFDPMFQNVKKILEKPNILTANQESVLGGTQLGVSSYPLFNSPHEVADALVHAGVDIVSTANNHSLDQGEKGIDSEVDYLDQIGLPHVGSYKDVAAKHKLTIIEKNGIKLAFLSYTYGTNGIPIPSGKDFLVNMINRSKMAADIRQARKTADVVVISIHWGYEYKRLPNKEQKELAVFLANKGADIIFGSHPHVLQPMEWIKAKDGRKVFVVFSLGNFLTGQSNNFKDIGGMATINITKKISKHGKSIMLSDPHFFPTYVSSHKSQTYRVVPLAAAGHFGLANAKQMDKKIQNHMNQLICK